MSTNMWLYSVHTMSALDFLALFGFSFLFLPCEGRIISPKEGEKYIFLPGRTGEVTWIFDDAVSNVRFRSWSFTNTTGHITNLGEIFKNQSANIAPTLFDFVIVKPATLVLKNVDQRYNGIYTLSLITAPTGKSVTRDVKVFIAEKPNVKLNCPSLVTLNEGENFTCLCKGEGGNPPANVTWFKDGVKFSDVGTENQTLTLLNVGKPSPGTYKCVATSYSHENYTNEKSFQVVVYLKPNVVFNCSSPVTLNEGDNFTCLCRGEGGYPPANVTWYKDAVNCSDVGTVKQTLNLLNVGGEDDGTYKCIASSYPNENYTDENFIQVVVYYKPTNTDIEFSEKPVVINGSVTIMCRSDGFPEPFYTIYGNDKVVSTNKRHTISQVKWEDAGTYKCIATNTFGRNSDYDYLNVTKNLKPTMLPIKRSTSRSLSNTSITDHAVNGSGKADSEESNYSGTKWYIVVLILVSGIILGILLAYIVSYSRRKFKSGKSQPSNPEPPTSQVDSTYQELDLNKMNKEDGNYESLGRNGDNSTYAELNKTRDEESNYQSLT